MTRSFLLQKLKLNQTKLTPLEAILKSDLFQAAMINITIINIRST